MSDLIRRDDVIRLLHYNCDEHCSAVVSEFEELHAADAVEVVRCKDCMMFCPQSGPIAQHCFVTGNVVSDDDFCSFGERREENE